MVRGHWHSINEIHTWLQDTLLWFPRTCFLICAFGKIWNLTILKFLHFVYIGLWKFQIRFVLWSKSDLIGFMTTRNMSIVYSSEGIILVFHELPVFNWWSFCGHSILFCGHSIISKWFQKEEEINTSLATLNPQNLTSLLCNITVREQKKQLIAVRV